jgi:hypothetical protein
MRLLAYGMAASLLAYAAALWAIVWNQPKLGHLR